MYYRCPLCLKLLQRDDRVFKFCPRHRNANPSPVEPYSPEERDGGFRCSEGSCTAHQVVRPDGLVFRHEGCELEVAPGIRHPSTNPFWNGIAVQIEDYVEVDQGGVRVRLPVHHWEIEALRQVQANSATAASEMWFPAALLPRKNDRRHVLVSLTGAKNAGKTYLAMRALDPECYSCEPRPSDDFFFIHQGSTTRGDASDFLRTLYQRQLLYEGRQREFALMLAATAARPRNLKVALFPEAPSARPAPWMFRALGLGGIYQDLYDTLTTRGQEPEASFRALMLYDLSGESVERDNTDVLRHDGEVDVLAVLLSLEDLQGTAPAAGLPTARGRLTRIRQVRLNANPALRTCLVITKCDRHCSGAAPSDDQLRTEVLEMARRRGEALLAEALENAGQSGATLDAVFFTSRVEQADRDEVRGLEQLVRWCLG